MLAWKNIFKGKKKNQQATGSYGIELSTSGVAVIHLSESEKGRPTIDWQESRLCSQSEWLPSLLDISKMHPLAKDPCWVSLDFHFYQLLLIDAPEVEEEEIKDAVRWKVADLIEQPIEEMVSDVFTLPGDAYRGRMKMVYVAIVARQFVQQIVSVVADAGFNLTNIGIGELSIAEYMNWLKGYDDVNLAILKVGLDGAQVCLLENNHIYMVRAIDLFSPDMVSGEERSEAFAADNVVLEVQRSMDYYESQLGKPAIEMCFTFSSLDDEDPITKQLTSQLTIPLTAFPLQDIFSGNEEVNVDLDDYSCLAMGAALLGYRQSHVATD